ncbi:MAG: tetratricopeptide repeat protein [Candidatus Auribacterota bacterium]|nr:tetratricopeptide repeat protein [Candidatus Auribacterota bacterium]
MDITSYRQAGRRFPWPAVAIITLAGIAVYFTSLSGAFIWDDNHFISNNIYLRSPSYLPRIFIGDVAAGSGESYNYYRPLTTVTYLFDYSFWHLNPVGYHISGIFFHILVALAVYFFLRVLFRDDLIAFIAALLYVIHPIHTETVAYISGRPDSLAALTMLICFISYLQQESGRKSGWGFLTILFYLLALFSRENSVVLPGLILLYHISFRKKIRFFRFLPLIGLSAGYILIRSLLLEKVYIPTTLLDRLPGFFYALMGYLRLLVLPIDLHQEYGLSLFRYNNHQVMLGVMLGAVGLVFACRSWVRRRELLIFSIFWFIIALSPVSGIYPIKAYIAEHWLYLPSIGMFTILAAGYAALLRRDRFRLLFLVLGIVGLLFFGILTARQNRYFHEPMSFYERTLTYTPTSARMRNNLGNIYFTRGRIEDAIESYRKAIDLEPEYPNPYNNLGNVFYKAGKYDRAIPLFERAIRLNPNYAAAYNNLGIIYCRRGETDKGISLLKRSAAFNPRDADTFYNLGVIYDMTGRSPEAVAAYRESLRLNPDNVRCRGRLERTLRGSER